MPFKAIYDARRQILQYGVVAAASVFFGMTGSLYLGQRAEEALVPVVMQQRIRDIYRIPEKPGVDDGKICWSWDFYKLLDRESQNYDMFLHIPAKELRANVFLSVPKNMDSGLFFNRNNGAPADRPVTRHYCADTPTGTDAKPIHVEHMVTYAGFLGLWPHRTPIPAFDVAPVGIAPSSPPVAVPD